MERHYAGVLSVGQLARREALLTSIVARL